MIYWLYDFGELFPEHVGYYPDFIQICPNFRGSKPKLILCYTIYWTGPLVADGSVKSAGDKRYFKYLSKIGG